MGDRILSGMRPSGKLHLGHYFGALVNWVKLQDQAKCFYLVADWHSLTTEYTDTSLVQENIMDMVIDWLALGIDPQKSTIFRQSMVKEHAELHLILSMITPLSWLERNPTYKEQQQELKNKDLSTYGFLGYPVLQAADIILYKANKVPVGFDQLPHLELTREIARRFNFLYSEIFPVPEALLTKVPKIVGLDGRKMSKSYGNSIFLSDDPKIIKKKVSQMITDPARVKRNDPGHPEVCSVFSYHKIYLSTEHLHKVENDCRMAQIGCVECKKKLAQEISEALTPFREKRKYYVEHIDDVHDIISYGGERAQCEAAKIMEDVRSVIKI